MHKVNLGKGIKNVHFIGIGGISMSGLAEILHREGYTVSGSDWMASDITKHLSGLGIKFKLGNDAAHITEDIDLVIHTAAVKPDNPELSVSRSKNIPIIDRAKLLGIIMEGYKYSVAVAGVHGKTTTTAIISEVLMAAQLDPTISIGGFIESLGSNFRIGNSPYLVLEACEYFDSFLQFYPNIGVILNIDSDHLDYFGSLERLMDSFHRYAKNIPKEGTLVIHKNTEFFDDVTSGLECNIITYGTSSAHFWAKDIRYDSHGMPTFYIMNGTEPLAEVTLQLRGTHNIDNSLAAIAVASALNIPINSIIKGLSQATGAKRRFEHKGTFKGMTVVDDYAHHPTEIKASLSAAANGTYKRIICAFQSHTYTRTQNLLAEFAASFEYSDIVLILPIYAAREVSTGPYPNYLAELLTDGIQKHGKTARFMENFEAAAQWLEDNAQPDDLLITMGAGDIHVLGENLISTGL
ncbi:MAG: UDP-N-acetylmuramate--L-alanine ligase [Defluviitaleaceae bacterium]|nr:UDP-N-acetylmuramate--L-alanine ligase [Defluviitaleaceae bacterium]